MKQLQLTLIKSTGTVYSVMSGYWLLPINIFSSISLLVAGILIVLSGINFILLQTLPGSLQHLVNIDNCPKRE